MEMFKNKVGRPSNETLLKRKKIKTIMIIGIFLSIGLITGLIYKVFFSINPIEGSELNITPSTNKFTIENLGNNCYTIYSPTIAKNWRVQVYYKKTGTWFYGSNKMIEHNHYNDYSNMQKICLTKQKNNKETYRILVKWTKGANDRSYTAVKIKNWKPDGWSYNLLTGWAYIDLKVDWGSSTNNDNPPNKNIDAVKYSIKGTNGSLRINSEKYDTGKEISQAVVGNNYVFTNSNGQTKVNVKVEFPKEIYNYVKSNVKSGEETKDLFKIVSYDKDNKVVSDSGLTRISSQYHSKEVVITNKVTAIKIFVYAPGTTSMTAGNKLKEITINITTIPTITTKTTGERIPNNNGDYKDSFTTYGDKSIYFTINNPNNVPVYLRWMTYPNYDAKEHGWIDDKCREITSTDEREVKLGVTESYPKRKGIYKVFADEKSCMGNSNELTARTVWYEYAKTSTTNDGFKQISNFNIQKLSSKVGTQKDSACFSAAMAYGVYMLSNGEKIASKTSTAHSSYSWNGYTVDDKKFVGNAIGMWNYIKTKIDANIPLVIHTQSISQHYVTIYAYKQGYMPSKSDDWAGIAKNIKVIDPFYSYSHYNNYSVTLVHGIAYNNSRAYPFYGDGRVLSWKK